MNNPPGAQAHAVRPHFRMRMRAGACLAFLGIIAGGCSFLSHPPRIAEPINQIAVLPIERAEAVTAIPGAGGEPLLPGAERVVTAQIYSVLSSSPRWRFVPDLTTAQTSARIPPGTDLESRARALGKAVSADAVLAGMVSRFVEREGTEYGARRPASVSLTLQLISTDSGKVLWKGSFDETQKALSSNLFNWWQFWRGGPRWFTAAEFTRLGVEHLLNDLSNRIEFE